MGSLLILSMLFLCSTTLLAQQKTLSGVVTESNGDPAVGATVR